MQVTTDLILFAMGLLSAVAGVWWKIDSKFDMIKALVDEHKKFEDTRRSDLWKALADLERRYDQRFLTYVETSAQNRAIWRKEIEDAIRIDLGELKDSIDYLRSRIDTVINQRAVP